MKITTTQRPVFQAAKPAKVAEEKQPFEAREAIKEVMTWTAASAGVGAVGMGSWATLLYRQAGATPELVGVLALAAAGAGVAAAAGTLGGILSVALDHFVKE